MRLSSIVVALPSLLISLACSVSCMAQTGSTANGQMPMIQPSRECPVSVSAEPRAYGHTMLADENNAAVQAQPQVSLGPSLDPRYVKGDRSGVRVTLRVPGGEEAIRSAEVVLHAVARKPAVTPAAPAATAMGRATASRSFHLQAAGQPRETLSGMLWVTDVAGIESVTVHSIEYASGRMWHASEHAVCRTAPSLYLPVEK